MIFGEFFGTFPATLPMYHQTHADQERMMFELHHDQGDLVNYAGYSSSGGCGSSPSPSSYSAAAPLDDAKSSILAQKSASCHSLRPADIMAAGGPNSHRLMDLIEPCSVRRVFSAGDLQLQQMHQHHQLNNNSSTSNESGSSFIEEILCKACRYSPEEKKERIERYKNKRGQRNFNKKIKYACRKTLADSRPRIRGRFAKNNRSNEKDDERSQHNKCGTEDVVGWGVEWDVDNTEDDSWVDLFNAAWCT